MKNIYATEMVMREGSYLYPSFLPEKGKAD